eukprot:1906155-Rhodomonas_salina.1
MRKEQEESVGRTAAALIANSEKIRQNFADVRCATGVAGSAARRSPSRERPTMDASRNDMRSARTGRLGSRDDTTGDRRRSLCELKSFARLWNASRGEPLRP